MLKRGLGAMVLALTLTTVACDDSVVAPDMGSDDAVAFDGAFHAKQGKGPDDQTSTKTAATGLTGTTTTAGTTATITSAGLVKRRRALRRDVTSRVMIGPEGGHVDISETGFRLEIPAGAVAEPTEITVTAKAGEDELYEFGPHGIRFQAPVNMYFATESVQAAQELVTTAQGVYLDDGNGVLEFFPLERSGSSVVLRTTHFSRYALAYFGGYALAW